MAATYCIRKGNLISAGVTAVAFSAWINKDSIWNLGATFKSYIVSIPEVISSSIRQGQAAALNYLDLSAPGTKELLLRRINLFSGVDAAPDVPFRLANVTSEVASEVAPAVRPGIALGTLAVAAIPVALPLVKYAGTALCRWWQAGNQMDEVKATLKGISDKSADVAVKELKALSSKLKTHLHGDKNCLGYNALSNRQIVFIRNRWNLALTAVVGMALIPQLGVGLALGMTLAGTASSVVGQWRNRAGNRAMAAMTRSNIDIVTQELAKRVREQKYDNLMDTSKQQQEKIEKLEQLVRDQGQLLKKMQPQQEVLVRNFNHLQQQYQNKMVPWYNGYNQQEQLQQYDWFVTESGR